MRTKVGQGAMGVVWQAYDENLHRVVAAKELLVLAGLDDSKIDRAKHRAMREARLAARLEHPNAIRVYDAVEDDGQPWLIMEYLPSRSLAAVIAEQGTLPPREVARIGCYTAAALAAAHRNGIQHRDVKPGNVLIGDQEVKITDFGVSRATGDDGTATATGTVGTPAFFSPEIARGEEAGFPSDVFSLGATLYNAVEGTPPFGAADNHIAMLHRVASGSIMPPANAGPLLSPVLFRLLATDPERRPTMEEAVHLLAAVVNETPQASEATVVIPATVELPVEAQPEEKAKQQKKAGAAAAGAAAAGLVAGAAQAEAAGLTAPGKANAEQEKADADQAGADEAGADEAGADEAGADEAGNAGAEASEPEAAVAAAAAGEPEAAAAVEPPPADTADAPPAEPAAPPAEPVAAPEKTAVAATTPEAAQPEPAQPVPAPARPEPATPAAPVPSAQEEERRRNPLALLGIIVLVIAVGVGAFLLWPKGDREQAGNDPTGSANPPAASQSQQQPQQSQSQQPTTTAAETTTPQETTTTPVVPPNTATPPPATTPGTAQEALTAYYALIPGNLEAGYATLTDRFKATRTPTFQEYQQWWGQFSSVDLSDFAPQGDNVVAATLTYRKGGAVTTTERNTYTLVQVNGKWMIDSQSP
ncbi:protein kinase domain-containing protein [Lentzea chajnantorensis]